MSLHADAVRTLRAWQAPDAAQDALRRDFLGHLAAHDDGVWRTCVPAHLTASALVMSAGRDEVLLVLHTKAGLWLQPGGHCEPEDPTLLAAALREATEETGIEGLALSAAPVRLDRHPIPAPCHWHLDVQYAALAPAGAVAEISEESLDLRWFPYEEVAAVADTSVVRLLEATLARL